VASDVKEKIEIMEMFQAGANSTHFKTVRQMMNHEKDLLNDLKYISGSRTILRLHRALRASLTTQQAQELLINCLPLQFS